MSRRSGDSRAMPDPLATQTPSSHLPAADLADFSRRPTLLRLPAITAESSAPPPASAALHLIPASAAPRGPADATGGKASEHFSPRLNILKLALMGAVVFAVLAATLATAGGGKVGHLLFSAFYSVTPATPAAVRITPTRPPTPITQAVHPIIQANTDAGYDSAQQHDQYWDSACSAASFTEVMHAWGAKDVTIGHVIDEMSAHNPPYITSWGGLMSQEAWGYEGDLHHFSAIVQWHQALSYDDIVHTTTQEGLPVIVGVRDGAGRYYPALGGGHFLVVVGGDSAGLRIVDSSLYRINYLAHDEFEYLWSAGEGLTILLTPAT